MMFLLPVGGIVDHRFGILTSPGHKGVPAGIKAGMSWGGENEAFTRGFDPERFFNWLASMRDYRDTCLFIPVPDKVGSAKRTWALFERWQPPMQLWPLAFVAQDGQEDLPFPHQGKWQTLFIGGSTKWKMSQCAAECIRQAQALGKRVHIGRVNNWKRYHHFRGMEGSNGFTCDGTKTRYIGTARAVALWANYMERAYQLRLPLSVSNSGG